MTETIKDTHEADNYKPFTANGVQYSTFLRGETRGFMKQPADKTLQPITQQEFENARLTYEKAHSQPVQSAQLANAERQVGGIAQEGTKPEPKTMTKRPAGFDMTDEELAETGSVDYKLEKETEEQQQDRRAPPLSSHLSSIIAISQQLLETAKKEVVFSPPLIEREGACIVGRGTINVVQGREGAHKSRLAEALIALMLGGNDNSSDPRALGFTKTPLERFAGVYIDTERNHREEAPAAIQNIKRLVGCDRTSHPDQFHFVSIKSLERSERLRAVQDYLMYVRASTSLHLFAVLDVATDCVKSFNDDVEAMKLFDFLGNLCDNSDSTIFLVIHQNPGSEKARGHVGTESANKASTVLQIGFEQDGKGNDTELIKLRFKKIRRGPRPDPVFLRYSKEHNALIPADDATIESAGGTRLRKAELEDVADFLGGLFPDGGREKGEVVAELTKHFKCGERTIRDRLKEVVENRPEMYCADGIAVILAEYREDQKHYYRLEPS